ncbi:MAG: hypothetical protein ABH858_07125, partial [Candidatus Omnitrophota bacterium]
MNSNLFKLLGFPNINWGKLKQRLDDINVIPQNHSGGWLYKPWETSLPVVPEEPGFWDLNKIGQAFERTLYGRSIKFETKSGVISEFKDGIKTIRDALCNKLARLELEQIPLWDNIVVGQIRAIYLRHGSAMYPYSGSFSDLEDDIDMLIVVKGHQRHEDKAFKGPFLASERIGKLVHIYILGEDDFLEGSDPFFINEKIDCWHSVPIFGVDYLGDEEPDFHNILVDVDRQMDGAITEYRRYSGIGKDHHYLKMLRRLERAELDLAFLDTGLDMNFFTTVLKKNPNLSEEDLTEFQIRAIRVIYTAGGRLSIKNSFSEIREFLKEDSAASLINEAGNESDRMGDGSAASSIGSVFKTLRVWFVDKVLRRIGTLPAKLSPLDLYSDWKRQYEGDSDLLLSVFGEMSVANPYIKEFLDRIIPMVIQQAKAAGQDRVFSNTRLYHLLNILSWYFRCTKPEPLRFLLRDRTTYVKYSDLSDAFWQEFIRNRVDRWHFPEAYSALLDISPDGENVCSKEARGVLKEFRLPRNTPNSIKTVILKDRHRLLKSARRVWLNGIPDSFSKFAVYYDAGLSIPEFYVTTQGRKFLMRLEKIVKKDEVVIGLKNEPQPLLVSAVMTAEETWVMDAQAIVRLSGDHPDELKEVMDQAWDFMFWCIKNRLPQITKRNISPVRFSTTGYLLRKDLMIVPSVAVRLYTRFPQKKKRYIVPSGKNNSPYFYWEFRSEEDISVGSSAVTFMIQETVDVETNVHSGKGKYFAVGIVVGPGVVLAIFTPDVIKNMRRAFYGSKQSTYRLFYDNPIERDVVKEYLYRTAQRICGRISASPLIKRLSPGNKKLNAILFSCYVTSICLLALSFIISKPEARFALAVILGSVLVVCFGAVAIGVWSAKYIHRRFIEQHLSQSALVFEHTKAGSIEEIKDSVVYKGEEKWPKRFFVDELELYTNVNLYKLTRIMESIKGRKLKLKERIETRKWGRILLKIEEGKTKVIKDGLEFKSRVDCDVFAD